jgi:hypothetical protein
MLLGKMDAVLDEKRNLVNCVGELEALNSPSETTTAMATGSEFSDDADNCASTTGNDNESPVVTNKETLTKAERKAVRVHSLLIFSFNSINTFPSYAFLISSAKFATYLERNGPTLPKSMSIPSPISSIPPRTLCTTF